MTLLHLSTVDAQSAL